MLFDTICAPITGPGPAPVCGIRISGPDAWEVASKVMPKLEGASIRRLVHGKVAQYEEGLGVRFDSASYTGEPSAELFVHGSAASRRHVLEACQRAGARPARPGEFTQRAFLNGKMDLAQAGAVRDAIEAETERQLRHASRLREGALGAEIATLRNRCLALLAGIEASVDFSEEVGEVDREMAVADLEELDREVRDLSARSRAGGLLRDGVRIAIVGRPNAGKSSLLNRLLGRDRAIVTEIPGTTRDTLEEAVEIAGLRCLFVDTAGLRDTVDPVEAIGVERALRAAQDADLVWFLYDLQSGWTPEDDALLDLLSRPVLRVGTKSDLAPAEGLAVSAHTGEGLEALFAEVAALVPEDTVLPDPRNLADFDEASEGLRLAADTFRNDLPDDLATVGLRQAIEALGRVTGEDAGEDVLERMFSQFCIGK